MREMLKLFFVIIIFSAVSGGLLATIQSATESRIEYQVLKFVKGPAVRQILEGATNDPLNDRFKIKDGNRERDFFVGKFGDKKAVAFEAYGKGFGGDIGVIVAVNVQDNKIVGVGITTLSETPGVGARVKTDPAFTAQFKGQTIEQPFKVKSDGGNVDALSGATVSSRGVAAALTDLSKIYERLKPQIMQHMAKA